MADEARNLKAYGELPENVRVNDTDAGAEEGEEGDDYIGACVWWSGRRGRHAAWWDGRSGWRARGDLHTHPLATADFDDVDQI